MPLAQNEYHIIAIVGSRYINKTKTELPKIEYTDYNQLRTCITEYILEVMDSQEVYGDNSKYTIKGKKIKIISGGAKGVDTLAKRYADDHHFKFEEFLPNYGKYAGWQAPLERNTTIAELCDEMIAVQINGSSGTNDVVNKARKLNKPVSLVTFLIK